MCNVKMRETAQKIAQVTGGGRVAGTEITPPSLKKPNGKISRAVNKFKEKLDDVARRLKEDPGYPYLPPGM